MRTIRFALTVVAVASLVALLGAGLVLGATVTVAEDDVEWATSIGEGISFIRPESTGVFFINDNAGRLETSPSVVDSWPATTTASLRRARVTSTSDVAGEYVLISEVSAVGTSTADPNSRIFRGEIAVTADASVQGTLNDGVWVQDGDTLTVSYLDTDGVTVVDTDTVTVDGVAPTISNISPADGTITNVANPTVVFDVTDTGSGISTSNFATDITLKINRTAATNISFQAIANGFRANFAQGTAWTNATGSGGFAVTDSQEFSLEITATDQAGNTQTVSGTSANVTIDRTNPVLSSARTGSANTAVVATFSDVTGLDAASIASDGTDFTVAGATVTAAAVDANNINKVNLTVSALASDARPQVTVSGTILDKAGNAVAANSQITATDGIKPGITSVAIDKSLAVKDDVVTVAVSVDERLTAVNTGIILSVNGPAGSSNNGSLSPTSPTPLSREGTLTVSASDLTGTYGVSIQVTDLGNNRTDNLTQVVNESAAFSGSVITLSNGPLGDSDFNGSVGPADVTVFVNGTTTGVTVTVVDASARTITLQAAPASGSTVEVTYHYVANDTFEIDQSAPTVTFDPADGASVATDSPVVTIIFDDDEYPGDSFKTVTVTAATLTKPDTSVLDILSSLATSDNITFTFAASSLDLGAHTLSVSGTDVAGNQITDAQSSFTVTNAAPVVVAGPDLAVDEASTLSLTQTTFTDPNGADTHTAAIDWGDGTSEAGTVAESSGSGTVSASHVYQDDDGGPFTVTVTVTDNSNVSDSDTLTVTVSNVDPVADAGANQSIASEATFVLAPATFTDVSAVDTHSAVIVWGDGIHDAGTVDQSNDTVSGSHVYVGDGTFPVTIVVIDDDGGFGVDTFTVKVGSGIPKLPVSVLSATQWALIILAVGFGVLLMRRRLTNSSRAPA
jgi:hypothetical protein